MIPALHTGLAHMLRSVSPDLQASGYRFVVNTLNHEVTEGVMMIQRIVQLYCDE